MFLLFLKDMKQILQKQLKYIDTHMKTFKLYTIKSVANI